MVTVDRPNEESMPINEEHSKIGRDVMALFDKMEQEYSDAAEVSMVGLVIAVEDGERQIVHFDFHDYVVIPGLTARRLLEHALTKL